MKELTNDEMKTVELDILSFLDKVCREHGLKYCIAYGTLLGAVRHKGFIPWDDDIDICMLRKDYNRLIDILSSMEGRYKLKSSENDKDYYFSFARVYDSKTKLILSGMREIRDLGLFVDVFPLDVAPDESEAEEWRRQLLELQRKVWITIPSKCKYQNYSLQTIAHIIKEIPLRIYYNTKKFNLYRDQFERHLQKFNNRIPKNYIVECGIKRFDASLFDDFAPISFENRMFMAPVNYDKYLTTQYGDYMQLPPEEKRVTHHHFKAFWK